MYSIIERIISLFLRRIPLDSIVPQIETNNHLFFVLFSCFGQRPNVSLCSFGLTPKNQKVKAYTSAATNSRRSAEISETRFAQTTEISFRSAWNLLYAASVRPKLLEIDNGK